VIVDERDASIRTDAIRLHRLVREVAAMRREGEPRNQLCRTLVAALAAVYPKNVYRNPVSWPRCAPLAPHVLAICDAEMTDGAANAQRAKLLDNAGSYFHSRGAYSRARSLFEQAVAIWKKVFGSEHTSTAASLNNSPACFRIRATLSGRGHFSSAR
jgi:Tetratricopeptide repeat